MVISDLLGSICFIAMATTSAPFALVGVKVLAAIVAAPLIPATGAALPRVAPAADLTWANARLAVAGTVASLVGPAVGGLLVASSGASLVFALNALTFLVSAFLILSLKGSLGRAPGGKDANAHERGLSSGFAFLKREHQLRYVTIAFAAIFLGIGLTLPADVSLADLFGVGSSGYGFLVALWGLGGLAGAWLAGGLLGRWPPNPILGFAAIGLALALCSTGASPVFGAALVAVGIAGAAEGVWQVAQQVLIQRSAPDVIRSRVLAANEAIAQGGMAVALVFGGILVNSIGARAVFYVAGLASAIGAVVLLVGTSSREPGPKFLSFSRLEKSG